MKLAPLARNLPTKTGSGNFPPDTTAQQSPKGETFRRHSRDGLASIPIMCLPRRAQTASSRPPRVQWRQSVAKAVQQIRPCFGKKLQMKQCRGVEGEWEALESLLIVVCCQMGLTLSSVQTKQPWTSSHFSGSLAHSPVYVSLMPFRSSKQTRGVLPSGGSVP